MLRVTNVLRLQNGRLLSTVAKTPREIIFEGIVRLRQIADAKKDSDLVSPPPKYDSHNLPENLKHFESYLAGATAKKADVGFSADLSVPHNKGFLGFVANEVFHQDTWPFVVGGLVVFALVSYMSGKLPAEGRKNSKYISRIEGRHGKLDTHDHHETSDSHQTAH